MSICSQCHREETLSDLVQNKFFIFILMDKTFYCDDCFNKDEDMFFYCERCTEWDRKWNTTDKNNPNPTTNTPTTPRFAETVDEHGDVIYYHIQCLPAHEQCPLCHEWLKNQECIDIFTDYGRTRPYHKACLEKRIKNKEDDIDDISDICHACGRSFRVKCITCDHRFFDCYNDKCDQTDPYYTDPYGFTNIGRYDGRCGTCNW